MSDVRIVKTQTEWDALPERFTDYTVIEIRASDERISISRAPINSSVEAWGSSSVEARGSSSVEARESSSVVAWEVSSVVARGSSRVEARGSSSVEARESSSVVAWEFSRVEARGSSSVEARGSSSVEARESSSVVAWEFSRVVARGRSTLHQKSSTTPQLHGQAACFLYDGAGTPIRKSDHATIIQVRKVDGVNGWLEEEGVIETGGKAILYKRVSKDYLTQEGTSNETTWAIGEIKTHPKWQPDKAECGGGKFHACSRPYFCDEFRSDPGDHYIAIEVAVADLYAWPNPYYPHKISFRSGIVLFECDKWGEEIETPVAVEA